MRASPTRRSRLVRHAVGHVDRRGEVHRRRRIAGALAPAAAPAGPPEPRVAPVPVANAAPTTTRRRSTTGAGSPRRHHIVLGGCRVLGVGFGGPLSPSTITLHSRRSMLLMCIGESMPVFSLRRPAPHPPAAAPPSVSGLSGSGEDGCGDGRACRRARHKETGQDWLSAPARIGQERQQLRSPPMGDQDREPVPADRADERYHTSQGHSQPEVVIGQLLRDAVGRGESPQEQRWRHQQDRQHRNQYVRSYCQGQPPDQHAPPWSTVFPPIAKGHGVVRKHDTHPGRDGEEAEGNHSNPHHGVQGCENIGDGG